jgi:dimethylhistidine N-methyltransferase
VDALLARQGQLDYMPIDISHSALEAGSQELLSTYPNLRVTALVADYGEGLRSIRAQDPQRNGHARGTLVLFLGSTIGNLGPADRAGLLRDVRGMLPPGDALLLGTDLKKPESVLVSAYDDPLGVTAAFNLNVLARINRELDGGFDLREFRHLARWNEEEGRIEMHLESRREQTVPIRSLDLEVGFQAGETIHTESSYKFSVAQVEALAAETGFAVARVWQDSGRQFASSLLVAR